MKVLLVNKYHYIKGGSETYLFSLEKLLKNKGHQVIHFSMEDEKNFPCDQKEYFSKNVDFNGKLSPFEKIKAGFHAIYSFDAKKRIENLIEKEKPDIVHINLAHRHLTLSIVDGIKKFNLPIVFTAHDLNSICPNHEMLTCGNVCEKCIHGNYFHCVKNKCIKNSTLKSLLGAIEAIVYKIKKTYNKIDLYITPSYFYKVKFEEAKITNKPIIHIKNFLPEETSYANNFSHTNYFLYFGRLSEEKGVLTLIKAYEKGKFENPLYIVGTGPLQEEFQEYVNTHNLQDKVIFTGFMQGEALKKYVRECKCVILPSEWYENGPYSIMEAMSQGKPVIVSNYGGLPEIVNHKETGFICKPKNINSLCNSMKDLNLLSEEEYNTMCEKALKKCKEEFDPEKYYEKLIEEYKKLTLKNN